MVLIVPHGFEPNYTVGLVRGLMENHVDLHVITSDEDHDRIASLGIACTNLRGGVSRDRSRLRKFSNLLCYYGRLTLFIIRARPAVLHFTGIFRNELIWFEGLYLSALFRLGARRYVYTVHNILPHGCTGKEWFIVVYRLVYHLPHVLLVHTRASADDLHGRFSVPAAKLRMSSIGLNEEIPVAGITREAARTRIGLDQGARVILFFGRIDHYKGLDILITAVQAVDIQDLALVIAGSFGRAGQRPALLDEVARLREKATVVVHDRGIPNEAVEVFFRSADLIVLPYREVTQSGVLFLALSFGLPIVASDVGGLSEYVDGEIGILAPAGDAAALAAAIERFFADPSAFATERITSKARQYRWNNVAGYIATIYRESAAAEL